MFFKLMFDQPSGLNTLFFTEMWERMSYYGMRALLVLFMAAQIETGGLGLSDQHATAIYGIYTASVYLLAIPGGWIADRLIGSRSAIFYGGSVIAAGHFVLAIPSKTAFFFGLCLVAIGTGLLKPNISAMVGELYDEHDKRRDAGFTIFYMGINIGGFLGPLVCGFLGQSETFGWHWGFGTAGVGMVIGLIQYKFSIAKIKHIGNAPSIPSKQKRSGLIKVGIGVNAFLLIFVLVATGTVALNPVTVSQYAAQAMVAVFFIYFAVIFAFGKLNLIEKKRLAVVFVLCFASALFWSGFEQAGSSFNLFADRYTDNVIEAINFTIPSSWYQSLNSFFIITLAPFVSAIWIRLALAQMQPNSVAKFGFGLVFLGLGFVLLYFASKIVIAGNQVLPYWLIGTYFFHTLGELCLSPVGLSVVSRLSPKRFTGQFMGLWFCSFSLGSIIAGLLAGEFNSDAVNDFPALFTQVTLVSVGAGILLLVVSSPLHKWSGTAENQEEKKHDSSSSALKTNQ